MIIEVLLDIVFTPLEFLIGLLPASEGLPASVSSAVGTLWNYVWAFDYILPASTLLTLMVLVFGFEAGVLVWKSINWVIRKIPGVS